MIDSFISGTECMRYGDKEVNLPLNKAIVDLL